LSSWVRREMRRRRTRIELIVSSHWPAESLSAQDDMDAALVRFVDFLNRKKTRATYEAIADAAEVSPRSVGALLGEKCPRASWVVNKATGEPTGYAEHQKDPDLHRNSEIIMTGAELIRRIKRDQ